MKVCVMGGRLTAAAKSVAKVGGMYTELDVNGALVLLNTLLHLPKNIQA